MLEVITISLSKMLLSIVVKKYLFSIPYTPTSNAPIENYLNQIKHYLKLNKKVLKPTIIYLSNNY